MKMVYYTTKLIFCLFACTLLAGLPSLAATIEEMQELRLARAELAFVDGKKKEALKILYDNLDREHFHLESFVLLAKIHFSNKDFSKGFRSYYYAIKQLHHDALTLSDGKSIKRIMEITPGPPEQALELYQDVAKKYYELYDSQSYPASMSTSLLQLSYKYYTILEYYQYNPAETKYMLGLLNNRMKKYNLAIKNILEAKELFIEQDEKQNTKSHYDDLDFLVGNLLIRQGKIDAGSIYLKSIYLNPQASTSIKGYANVYMEALAQSYTSFNLSLGLTDYTNPHQIYNSYIDNFANYRSTYKRVTGTARTLGASVFHASAKTGNWQNLYSLGFSESRFLQKEIGFADTRTYSGSFQLQYDNLKKSLFKVGYAFYLSHYKTTNGDYFHKYSLIHVLSLQYSYALKAGLLSYKIPLTFNDYSTLSDTLDTGIEISLTPYYLGKMWSPSYNISYTLVDEGPSADSGHQFSFGLSNHYKQSDLSSIFFDPYYVSYSNSDSSLGYNQWTLPLSWSFYLDRIGISQTVSFSWNSKTFDNNKKINESITSINWSYNF